MRKVEHVIDQCEEAGTRPTINRHLPFISIWLFVHSLTILRRGLSVVSVPRKSPLLFNAIADVVELGPSKCFYRRGPRFLSFCKYTADVLTD